MSSQVASSENQRRGLETIQDIVSALGEMSLPDQACSTGREAAHYNGACYSPLNGRQPIFALLGYDDIRTLEGRLLTIIDASFADPQQRKAVKDLVRSAIWFNWVKYLDTDNPSGGMPVTD